MILMKNIKMRNIRLNKITIVGIIKRINDEIIRNYNKYIYKIIYFIKNTVKNKNFLELFYNFNVKITRTENSTKNIVNGLLKNSLEGKRYSYKNCITRITREVGIWTN